MPGPPVPLLDANRQLLAESEREGFCVGEVYYATRGAGDEKRMNECISVSTVDNTVNHRRVQPAFCNGIISAGLQITPEQCMEIMDREKFWPTLKGSLSNSWNQRFPYPGAILASKVQDVGTDNDRGGSRGDTNREDNLR